MLEILHRSTTTKERPINIAIQSAVGFVATNGQIPNQSIALIIAGEGKTVEDTASAMLFMFPCMNWDKHMEAVLNYMADLPATGIEYAIGSFANCFFKAMLEGTYVLPDNPHPDSVLIAKVAEEGSAVIVAPGPAAVIQTASNPQ
ncbi:hypothetical protein GC174_15225 [bacterium]|nr:hypothetical protein [bacterium]